MIAMNFLQDFIKSNPFTSLLVPTSLSGVTFFGNLFTALSDGQIDTEEMHQLLSSASGLQTLLLVVIMFALKIKAPSVEAPAAKTKRGSKKKK